jgi:hypothetical protein
MLPSGLPPTRREEKDTTIAGSNVAARQPVQKRAKAPESPVALTLQNKQHSICARKFRGRASRTGCAHMGTPFIVSVPDSRLT